MKQDVNLLPSNLQVTKNFASAIKLLRALDVIFIVGFVIFSLAIGAFFIYSKITLGDIQKSVTQLETQVKAKEASEQRLILLKDRIVKVNTIKSSPNALKNVSNLDLLFANMSPAYALDKADIGPQRVDISLILGTNENLTTLFKNVKDSLIFTKVNLTSFSYGAGGGYSVGLNLNNK